MIHWKGNWKPYISQPILHLDHSCLSALHRHFAILRYIKYTEKFKTIISCFPLKNRKLNACIIWRAGMRSFHGTNEWSPTVRLKGFLLFNKFQMIAEYQLQQLTLCYKILSIIAPIRCFRNNDGHLRAEHEHMLYKPLKFVQHWGNILDHYFTEDIYCHMLVAESQKFHFLLPLKVLKRPTALTKRGRDQ